MLQVGKNLSMIKNCKRQQQTQVHKCTNVWILPTSIYR